MTTRRTVLTGAALLLGVSALSARVRGACSVFTKAKQAAMTPEQALARLKEGNARFVAGGTVQCDLREQVKATAGGQAPFAAVLGCMDSRVPPELIFDQVIGDIFAVRIAGNFVNTDILGSLEYATQVAGAKLIVVLGHTDCGAVKGAIEEVKLGNLTAALANIRPAILEVTNVEGPHDVNNKKFLRAVTERNATYAAALLTARSEVLGDLVSDHKLMIASAVHDVSTGVVAWLGNPATGNSSDRQPGDRQPGDWQTSVRLTAFRQCSCIS